MTGGFVGEVLSDPKEDVLRISQAGPILIQKQQLNLPRRLVLSSWRLSTLMRIAIEPSRNGTRRNKQRKGYSRILLLPEMGWRWSYDWRICG